MANNDCLPQLQACAMRVTYLDGSGVPNPGSQQLYVTKSFTEIVLTPVYEDGDEITEKTACGEVGVNFKSPDSFKRADIQITVVQQDPYLQAMLGQGDVLTDAGVRGYAFPPIGSIESDGVSIEVWARRIDDGDMHAEFPWAWWVFPKVTNLRHNARTFNNGSQLPQFTGQALENENWLDGPLNDWPVGSDRVAQWFPVADLPDTSTCGPQTLAAS